MHRVNLEEKLSLFDELWSPKIVGELNGQYIKVVKLQGEYVWHAHAQEDEMFLVLKGRMDLHFRNEVVRLGEGEFCIVPRGVEHKPMAPERCEVLLFEPISTRNTGDADHRYTIEPEDLEEL